MKKTLALVALVGAVGTAACDAIGQAMTSHTDVVARAAGHELTVQETGNLMAVNPQLPLQAEVVDAIANLWVDYTLLATAAAEDPELTGLDLDALVRPSLEQEIVFKLRDQVIQVDTTLTDEQLRALYEQEKPGLEVKARHILLRVPADATPAQRDSVMQRAQQIRQRAVAGEDFAELAREFSEEPGAEQTGGDLGFFGRGQMVQPFEEAAFALEPGAISDIVETPFGYHIIKVEDRRLPPFEEVKDQFREQAKVEQQLKAEEAYITQLVEPLDLEVDEDAFAVARELAQQPNQKLSGRAASRKLVTYTDGAVTAGEFQSTMRGLPPGQRGRYVNASDEQLTQILRGLAQNEILVAEAQKQGFRITPEARDSLADLARQNLKAAIAQSGLDQIQPAEGQTMEQAIEAKVETTLKAVITGRQTVLPLGPLAYTLRDAYDARIYERAFADVLARAQEMRPAAPPAGAMPPQVQPQPQPQPDGGSPQP